MEGVQRSDRKKSAACSNCTTFHAIATEATACYDAVSVGGCCLKKASFCSTLFQCSR